MSYNNRDIIVIGSSSGGYETLPELLQQFPRDIPAAIFVVQHMEPNAPAKFFLENLQKNTELICHLGENDLVIEYGHVYIAPPDHHMLLKNGRMLVVRGPRENRYRPSIDTTFRSAAAAYDSSVVGILLTGLLDDGTSGFEAIKKSGGITIVQDPREAFYPEMPRNAIKNLAIDHVVPINEMYPLIVGLMNQEMHTSLHVPDQVRTEAAIAERYVTEISEMEKMGNKVPYSCPECGGTLWEVADSEIKRFRCHVGHAFNEQGFLKIQSEKMEETLWVSLRMLEERIHMLVNMEEKERRLTHTNSANNLKQRVEEIRVHISRLRDILSNNEFYRHRIENES